VVSSGLLAQGLLRLGQAQPFGVVGTFGCMEYCTQSLLVDTRVGMYMQFDTVGMWLFVHAI
jgi:hypothetical protein